MRATPRRSGRQAWPGTRFLVDVLAENVRVLRTLRHLTQPILADRMTYLGHTWTRTTVSEVERAARNVTVDELLALAICLSMPVPDLLDPAGIDRRGKDILDVGPLAPLPGRTVRHILRGEAALGLQTGDIIVREGEEPDPSRIYTDQYIVYMTGQEEPADEVKEDLKKMAANRANSEATANRKQSVRAKTTGAPSRKAIGREVKR